MRNKAIAGIGLLILSVCLTGCGHTTVPSDTTDKNTDNHSQNGSVSLKDHWAINIGDDDQSVLFNASYGEWKRQRGLYSFYTDGENLFVDDSGHGRVIWVKPDNTRKYIALPDHMVCKAMTCNKDSRLYMLLYDNDAVEPAGNELVYTDLKNADDKIYMIKKTYAGDILSSNGKSLSISDDKIQSTMEKLPEIAKSYGIHIDAKGLIRPVYFSDDRELYQCSYAKKGNDQTDTTIFLVVQNDKIIYHTRETNDYIPAGTYQSANIISDNGNIYLYYLSVDKNNNTALIKKMS